MQRMALMPAVPSILAITMLNADVNMPINSSVSIIPETAFFSNSPPSELPFLPATRIYGLSNIPLPLRFSNPDLLNPL
jgi:hypothetical protein